MSNGVVAPIATPPAVLEGAIWPTFITSSSPATHGMFAYLQIKPGSYGVQLGLRADRLPAYPFWYHLSKAGKKVAVIDAPFAKPLRGLNGIQVTNWGAHDEWSWDRCSWPKGLVSDLTRRFGEHPVDGCDAKNRTLADYEDLRDRLIAGVRIKTAMLEYCFDMADWDFFFGVFSESHCVGHQFWHFMEPGHPRYNPAAPEPLLSAIRDVYAEIDKGVGSLIEKAPPETHVLVIMSHGMGPCYHGSHLLKQVLERLSVSDVQSDSSRGSENAAVQNIGRSARRLLWGARRILPSTLRELLKSRLPAPVNGLWEWANRESSPWSRMRAFQVPSHDMTSAIRINLKGREPAGLVNPGKEYDDLCRRLTEALLALENTETGKKAVRWVERGTKLYTGPRQNELPDLFIEWDHDAPIRSLSSPEIGIVSGVYSGERTGSHFPNGLLLGLGPDWQPGWVPERIRTLDVGTTILDIFGFSIPRDYEGKSVLEFLRRRGKGPASKPEPPFAPGYLL
jgi:predicted AlkP superfamily phosphohydrolase/phosphomutase